MRTWDQRIILDVFSNHMIAVSLSGYLFFGSAIAVSDKLIGVRIFSMCSEARDTSFVLVQIGVPVSEIVEF